MIMTFACARPEAYGFGPHKCTSKVCECPCHKDSAVLRQEAQAKRVHTRELAHKAVKDFDRQPDLTNTQIAILALTQYEQALKEARHGR